MEIRIKVAGRGSKAMLNGVKLWHFRSSVGKLITFLQASLATFNNFSGPITHRDVMG